VVVVIDELVPKEHDLPVQQRGKKLFGGEKEELLQVIVNVGTFYMLTVQAEQRAEVDALIAELEQARDRASSQDRVATAIASISTS
jgi:hypothetical protein